MWTPRAWWRIQDGIMHMGLKEPVTSCIKATIHFTTARFTNVRAQKILSHINPCGPMHRDPGRSAAQWTVGGSGEAAAGANSSFGAADGKFVEARFRARIRAYGQPEHWHHRR
jgi:hypothetical protein